MSTETKLIPVIHSRGRHACGEVAFYARREIPENDRMLARDFEHTNGGDFLENEQVRCDNCRAIAMSIFPKTENGEITYIFHA